jgi:hypothetical protein
VAAFALALGAALIAFTKLRRRESYAGASFDLFTAAEPAPAPTRPPAAPRPIQSGPPARLSGAPQPALRAATGLVSSRLRPSLEIAVQPLRCHADADQVVLEFELELFNAGAAPARAVLAEASLLNASATQDDQLAKFFANPIGEGERLDLIPPMKRVSFTSRVVAPRSSILEYELGGRKAFVPVIAFNALYRWSGGEAQTSAAYVVGRDTNGDKLGPLRFDERRGDVGRLSARLIPAGLRT